jgi:hypothetical protein
MQRRSATPGYWLQPVGVQVIWLPGPVVHVQVLLPELPLPVTVVVVVWQLSWAGSPLQTGWGGQVHVAVDPPVLSQVQPEGHWLQLAASAAVVPNANNDIEVSNNNGRTRNMGPSADRGEAGVVSQKKIPCWQITSLDWEEEGLDLRETSPGAASDGSYGVTR